MRYYALRVAWVTTEKTTHTRFMIAECHPRPLRIGSITQRGTLAQVLRYCAVALALLGTVLIRGQTPPPASAPIPLEAMVSTGESDPVLQKPVSITRLYGDELEKRGVDELPDLQSVMPNGIFRSGGTRSLNHVFGFRGVVNNAFYGEPAVSLYVDDVPYAMTLSYDAAMLDVDHIDIYRGPQFTRFGRRGATGLISI